jgi:hypothetical protein
LRRAFVEQEAAAEDVYIGDKIRVPHSLRSSFDLTKTLRRIGKAAQADTGRGSTDEGVRADESEMKVLCFLECLRSSVQRVLVLRT